MMRCAETIGPKSNMDQVLEPQELTDRSLAPPPLFLQLRNAVAAGAIMPN
jgi:hypothetical protein